MSLERELGQINESLKNIGEFMEKFDERFEKIEVQVDGLKSWKAYCTGAFAVVSALFWYVIEKL